MHKSLIKNIIEANDITKLKELSNILIDTMNYLEDLDYDIYEKYKLCIYEILNGKKISEEIALEWVQNMRPYGMKWTIDETTRAMQDKGWNLDIIDFFVVSNMMFNDYNDLITNNEDLALNLAKDWLNDKDVKDDKLYNYYKYIV